MGVFLIKWGKWFFPILGCIALFLFMHVMQKLGTFQLPATSVGGLAVLWGVTAFGYLLRLKLLNRIGGWAVVFVATIIMAGMLLPDQTVEQYPQKASESVSRDFDSAWKTIYGKDLFKEYSLHKHLMQYAESLSKFDVHRAGQVGLFGLFGISLGICFLFPIDPSNAWNYWRCILFLLIAGGLWSLQMELLQVLSPTREVTFIGLLESLIGITLGVFFFALGDVVYVHYKKTLEDRRFNVLGVGIDAVNMNDCLQLFQEIIEQGAGSRGHGATSNLQPPTSNKLELSSGLRTRIPAMTTAMGVAGIVESRRNQKLQRILNESVLNTPDGMPLVWLGKLFGQRRIERVYGPDLLRDACAYGEDKGWRHYFWGAAPGIVEKLAAVLEEKHPKIKISGICCPPFRPLTEEEEDQLVEDVNSSNTDIFWIGISTPKQLYFMDHIRARLNCRIICPVGYAFDVNAGVEKDAPDWIKYAGLQWLHRGIKQPRLWKRYLPDNPAFILKVFAQILHLKKFPMFAHERPVVPVMDAEGYPRFPAGVVSLSAMTLQSARDRIINWIETGQKHYVNICAADTVVQCYDRPDMAKIVMESGMATTDGMPLVWLAKHFGFTDATRVYGPDLMLALMEETSGTVGRGTWDVGREKHPTSNIQHPANGKKCFTHYFYGATDEVLEQLRENLLKKFPELRIAGMYSPPFRPLTDEEKDEVAERINEAKPDIVWCGLGTPKQDYWVAEFRPRLNAAAILAVGAAFNFHAGHVRQAPRWLMKSGLEWLFRLCIEPRRLWKRYIIGNPRFILQTLKQWIRSRSIFRKQENLNHKSYWDLQGSNLKRTNVLGVGVSSLNMNTAVETLLAARANEQTGYVCVTGVHGVIESQRDPELKRIHNRSFLTVPDGMPTVWMGREQGFTKMGRVYGPDLMLRLCEATSAVVEGGKWDVGRRGEEHPASNIEHSTINKKCFTHFLYGSTPDVLEKLKTNLEKRFPGIQVVGTFSPPFRPLNESEEAELQNVVSACKPDFFWVGLSTPKQERFMYAHSACMKVEGGRWDVGSKDNSTSHVPHPTSHVPHPTSHVPHPTAKFPLEAGIMLGVGAAFPIHAGLQKDAPEWVKNSGLQWFYRLCQEPKRLWRRYLDIVPTFLWLTALQLLGIRKYDREE